MWQMAETYYTKARLTWQQGQLSGTLNDVANSALSLFRSSCDAYNKAPQGTHIESLTYVCMAFGELGMRLAQCDNYQQARQTLNGCRELIDRLAMPWEHREKQAQLDILKLYADKTEEIIADLQSTP